MFFENHSYFRDGCFYDRNNNLAACVQRSTWFGERICQYGTNKIIGYIIFNRFYNSEGEYEGKVRREIVYDKEGVYRGRWEGRSDSEILLLLVGYLVVAIMMVVLVNEVKSLFFW